MSRAGQILILADDLSGAAELAGIAFDFGLSAEVHREANTSSAADVISIDTDSRQLSPDEAAARLRDVLSHIHLDSAAWKFKKIDSLLRGNVRSEIEALLEATGLQRAVVVPANPSRGRTILAGRYLINGQPLDQTQLANDPHHPRRCANVLELLGDGTQPLYSIRSGAPLPAGGIVVPDVESGADLARLAGVTDASTIAAGAADYFTALLQQRCGDRCTSEPQSISLDPPALLICGSLAAWRERYKACIAARIPVVTVKGFGVGPRIFGSMLLGVGDEPLDSDMVLSALTSCASTLIHSLGIRTVLVEGGSTAAALANKLNWTRFTVVASAPAGVGVLRPEAAGAPLVLVKPGSYPWPDEIWTAFSKLATDR